MVRYSSSRVRKNRLSLATLSHFATSSARLIRTEAITAIVAMVTNNNTRITTAARGNMDLTRSRRENPAFNYGLFRPNPLAFLRTAGENAGHAPHSTDFGFAQQT